MKMQTGSIILENYRGNLTITTSNSSIILKDANEVVYSITGNRILPVGEYILIATPDTGYQLTSITVNGANIENNSTITLNYGGNFNIIVSAS